MKAANEWDDVPTFDQVITKPWIFDISGLDSILEYIGNNTHELRIETGDGVIRLWRHEPGFRPSYSWATYQPPSDASILDVIMRLGVLPEKTI